MAITLGLKMRMSGLTALIASVVTTGLQAWHKFTATTWSGSNRLPDSSPVGTNTAALYTGRGLSFDGVNDVVTIGATGVTVKTVVFYAYPDTSTEKFMQLQSSGAVGVGTSSGTMTTTGWTSPTTYVNGVASSTVTTGAWQQIAVTSATGISASNVLLGQFNTTFYSGDLSNVKFFSTQLSAAQIAELYANPEQALPTGSVAADLVGWWPMLEQSTGIAVNAVNGISGVVSGATSVTAIPSPVFQPSIIGSSNYMWFDNVNDVIELPNATRPTGAFSVSVWFLAHSWSGGFDGIIGGRSGETIDAGFCLSGVSANLTIGWTGSAAGSTFIVGGLNANFPSGIMHHVAITWDGTTGANKVKVYKNGVLFSSHTSLTAALSWSTRKYKIGYDERGYFNGIISNFKHFSSELDAAAILELYNKTSIAAPLVSYTMMDVTGSTITDGSGNGNTGTVVGSPVGILFTQGTTTGKDYHGFGLGHLNSSSFIANSVEYASITDTATLDITTNITLEAWVKPFVVNVAQTIIGKNNAYALGITAAGKPVFSKWTSTTKTATATTTTTVTANTWTHLAATYDGTNVKLYINGTLNTTTAVSGAIDATATDVLMGALTTSTELFNGYIDSAKVYNAANTAANVLNNYNVEATDYA